MRGGAAPRPASAQAGAPAQSAPAGSFNVLDYGAVPNRSADSSSAFQAAALAAYNAGGGTVFVPHGYYNAMWDLYPKVVFAGEGRGATQIFAPTGVGPSRPIVGSGGRDDYQHGIKDMTLVGSVEALGTNKGERGIELISPNNDAHASPPGGAGYPNDPAPIIEDVQVRATGGLAVYVGTNMRGAWVDKLFVLNAKQGGLRVEATDASFSDLYIGASAGGPNIQVDGAANHFTNSKAFASVGGADNWAISGTNVTLASSESQDSSGLGLDVHFGTVAAADFVSDGDTRAARITGGSAGYNGGYNDIDMSVSAADRYLPSVGYELNNVANSRLRLRIERDVHTGEPQTAAGFVAFKNVFTTNDLVRNELSVQGQDVTQSPAVTNGALTPDALQGLTVNVTLTGNTRINALSDALKTVTPGKDLTFILTQDHTGGRGVTWDGTYIGAPAVNPAPGDTTTATFKNVSTTNTPRWKLVQTDSV
ncbi:MAG: hypothetical protein JO368_00950 [Acidimicrobiales bacterium]|nr:hypothetical protein [Acidimicrobiales bacterium]